MSGMEGLSDMWTGRTMRFRRGDVVAWRQVGVATPTVRGLFEWCEQDPQNR